MMKKETQFKNSQLYDVVELDLAKEKFDARVNYDKFTLYYNGTEDYFRDYLADKKPTNCKDAKDMLIQRSINGIHRDAAILINQATKHLGGYSGFNFVYSGEYNDAFRDKKGKIEEVQLHTFYDVCSDDTLIAQLDFRFQMGYIMGKTDHTPVDILLFTGYGGAFENILVEIGNSKDQHIYSRVYFDPKVNGAVFPVYHSMHKKGLGLLHVELANKFIEQKQSL